MSSNSDKIIQYCISVGSEFQARLNRIQSFVKHNLSSGTANETILREFLASHAPSSHAITQGFICDPFEDNKISRQCDILVYNQSHYPLVYSDGSVKIVFPQAARLVIEVKTNFNKKDILTGIENIESTKKLGSASSNIGGIIFAFQSPSLKTVRKHLIKAITNKPAEYLPDSILLLDENAILERQRIGEFNNGSDNPRFSIRKAKSGKEGLVIAYLLIELFTRTSNQLYAQDLNVRNEMLQAYTDHLGEDFILNLIS